MADRIVTIQPRRQHLRDLNRVRFLLRDMETESQLSSIDASRLAVRCLAEYLEQIAATPEFQSEKARLLEILREAKQKPNPTKEAA